ncbi:MAG: hypothetical protein OQK69_08730 [Gammaproteobacteria bacterium]|nr:hypothetical protein [Gammaproteobacteria bacterium]
MDWNLPTINSIYTDVIDYFKGRDDDCARMFSSGTLTNLPVNTIRWSPASNRWEIWSGSEWGTLTSKYIIDVDTLDGQHGSYYRNAGNLNAGTLPAARFNDTAHGNRAGGSMHAAVTTSVNGFMIASDKVKLNSIESGAEVTSAAKVDAAGAVMNSDTSVSSMGFIEETLTGSTNKVARSDAVKNYVDSKVSALNTKIINIGTWNMVSTANVSIGHGLTSSKIRTVEIMIIGDGGLGYPIGYNPTGANAAGQFHYTNTDVVIGRTAGGYFSTTAFDGSENRGYIVIRYTD